MNVFDRATGWLLGPRVPLPPHLPAGSLPPGVVLRAGRLIPWVGGLLARMGAPAAAVTLRRTVVINPEVRLSARLLAHELTHVRQWEEDRLFPVRYTLATIRHGYINNPYEVEARRVAASAPETSPVERLS